MRFDNLHFNNLLVLLGVIMTITGVGISAIAFTNRFMTKPINFIMPGLLALAGAALTIITSAEQRPGAKVTLIEIAIQTVIVLAVVVWALTILLHRKQTQTRVKSRADQPKHQNLL